MIPLRDDTPSSSAPLMTWLIIAANVLVFLYMLSLGSGAAVERFYLSFGAVPADLTGRSGAVPAAAYPTLFSSMFIHGGWFHLLGNMLYLWIFGDNVEDLTGRGGFLLFYLISGLAATGTHIVLNPASQLPLVGASGAIAGVLGGYLILFPRARVLTLIPLGIFSRLIAVPAVLFLPLWFVFQLFSGLGTLGGDAAGVAFWAHVGGFVAGAALIRLFARRRSAVGW